MPGAVPGRSTILYFGVAELVQRATVNRMIAGSSPASGAICCYRLMVGCRSLTAVAWGQNPLAAPIAHVSPRATNAEKGNWMEDAGSTPAVRANRVKDCGSRRPLEGCSRGSTPRTLTILAL